jgi:hypothetical protein
VTHQHNYSGNAGRCRRCGVTRAEGKVLMCELPEEQEFDREEFPEGSNVGRNWDRLNRGF